MMTLLLNSLVVFLVLVFCYPVSATTFVNRPFQEVITESSSIVRGKTGESYTDWGRSEQKVVYTYTKFYITEVLKGEVKEDLILLRQPGGSKDGLEMNVPGTATFKEDEEIVVFLGTFNKEDSSFDVPGFATGKYSLVRSGGETFIENSLGGAAIYDPSKDPKTLSYNSKIPLNLLRKLISGKATDQEKQNSNQYQASEKKPPAHAFEADHHEHHLPPKTKPTLAPQSEVPEENTGSNFALIFSIILFGVGVGFIAYLILKNRD